MRIQLTVILFFISFQTMANDDAKMKELFKKYDQLSETHKAELVEEVFSKKFLKESGGKEDYLSKLKELPKTKDKSLSADSMVWRKGVRGKMYFAKYRLPATSKNESGSEFVIIQEEGKLKIDGTISDAE